MRAGREGRRAKLAVQVGVWRQTINSIEKGTFHPNLWLAFKIAWGFGKRVEDNVNLRRHGKTRPVGPQCDLLPLKTRASIYWHTDSMLDTIAGS